MTDQPTTPQGPTPGQEHPAAPPAPPPSPSTPPVQPAPPSAWTRPIEPPGPAPGLQFGSPGPRLVAYIVDVLIVGAVTTLLAVVGGLLIAALIVGGSDVAAGLSGVLLILVIFIVSVAYFPFFWARNGQTPGMGLFHLRVVRDRDGGPISGGQAVLRLIGYWVSAIVFYLGFAWILIDSRRRGWYDLIAGTLVVQAD